MIQSEQERIELDFAGLRISFIPPDDIEGIVRRLSSLCAGCPDASTLEAYSSSVIEGADTPYIAALSMMEFLDRPQGQSERMILGNYLALRYAI